MEFILIVVGIAVVLWGADRFTDGACGLARRFNVSEMVIGLTVVALGTSLPEFIVSFMSVLRGSGDMSMGNIVGSNVFNTLVIIGASALAMRLPVEKSLLRRDIPICLAASLLLCLFAMTGGMVARWEALLLVAAFAAYLAMTYFIAVRDRQETEPSAAGQALAPLWKLLVLLVVGVAALVLGGRILVVNAAAIARAFHVSESVIGLTILAAGTSLPELATSIVAARKGSNGLALGNAIGSNVFNIAFVIGVCGSIMPMAVSGITLVDWTVLIGSCILLWVVAFTGRRLSRMEGVVLIGTYLVYLAWLIKG